MAETVTIGESHAVFVCPIDEQKDSSKHYAIRGKASSSATQQPKAGCVGANHARETLTDRKTDHQVKKCVNYPMCSARPRAMIQSTNILPQSGDSPDPSNPCRENKQDERHIVFQAKKGNPIPSNPIPSTKESRVLNEGKKNEWVKNEPNKKLQQCCPSESRCGAN
jgi:hypothetical protein